MSPRVFIHTRGDRSQQPCLEAWKEGESTFIAGDSTSKSYVFTHESLREVGRKAPSLKDGWEGLLKFRQGHWWFLRYEQGPRPQDKVSAMYRYDAPSQNWTSGKALDAWASNFEVLDENHILLFGLYSHEKHAFYLAGITSMDSPSVDYLEEAPIKRHMASFFWGNCITSIDDQMAYVYFPRPGSLYGFDRVSHSFKEFKAPWSPLSDASIDSAIASARLSKQKDCYIEAIDHPGSEDCYFMPMSPGRMGFVYKIIDQDMERRLVPRPDGTRPVVERAAAFMLFSDDPQMGIDVETPSKMRIDRWCWSLAAGRFISLESRLVKENSAKSRGKHLR